MVVKGDYHTAPIFLFVLPHSIHCHALSEHSILSQIVGAPESQSQGLSFGAPLPVVTFILMVLHCRDF